MFVFCPTHSHVTYFYFRLTFPFSQLTPQSCIAPPPSLPVINTSQDTPSSTLNDILPTLLAQTAQPLAQTAPSPTYLTPTMTHLTSQLTQSVHPITQSVHPITQSVHPITQSVHPITQSVHPITQIVHPITPTTPPQAVLCDGTTLTHSPELQKSSSPLQRAIAAYLLQCHPEISLPYLYKHKVLFCYYLYKHKVLFSYYLYKHKVIVLLLSVQT